MPRRLAALILWFRSLLRPAQVEGHLDAELQFHIDEHARELVAQGVSPAEARRQALRTFGGMDQVKESVRDTWRVRPIQDALQDLRYGVRVLAKAPTFTVVAALTLALGIGASTAIFSVVNAVLLEPLRYPGADRIVSVVTRWTDTGRLTSRLSGGDLLDVRDTATALEVNASYYGVEIGVEAGGRSEITSTGIVMPDFFRVFAVPAQHGRTFVADDVERAAVVRSGFAARKFGSGANALGRSLGVDGVRYEIVGVMPDDFRFPGDTDVWVPMPAHPENLNRTAHNYLTVARLRPDAALAQASAQLETLSQRLSSALPDTHRHKSFVAIPLQERLVGPVRATLYMLMGAVGLLLLIACANVANLLLARANVRSQEIALRAALGANRWRILRQLLVESVLLGLVGGAAGLLLAWAGTQVLVQIAPADVPRLDEVRVDRAVLIFAAAASMAASLVFGLAPAWQASQVDLRARLAQGGARGAVGAPGHRLRSGLAVAEIALAVVLAVGAGLLFRSFVALAGVELGFRASGVLVTRAHLPTRDLDDMRRAVDRFERLFPELAAVPGVERVSATVGLPMSSLGSNGMFAVQGKHAFEPGSHLPQANFRLTSPGYFETMGIPVRRGRDFTPRDGYESEFVAIISESLAAEVFPGEDPIGHRVQCGLDSLTPMTIVGVVGDIRGEPGSAPAAELYMPIAQHPSRGSLVQLVARTAVDPGSLVPAMEQRIRALDPEISTKFTTLEAMTSDAVSTPRFRTWLVGAFAAIALLVAVAGIYGLMTYLAAQRTTEMGVRLALGARPADVMGLVLSGAARLAAAGLLAGVALSLVTGRLLTSLLFGLTPSDAATYTVVTAVVLVVTLAAAAVPAWRAGRTDPAHVLREG